MEFCCLRRKPSRKGISEIVTHCEPLLIVRRDLFLSLRFVKVGGTLRSFDHALMEGTAQCYCSCNFHARICGGLL